MMRACAPVAVQQSRLFGPPNFLLSLPLAIEQRSLYDNNNSVGSACGLSLGKEGRSEELGRDVYSSLVVSLSKRPCLSLSLSLALALPNYEIAITSSAHRCRR